MPNIMVRPKEITFALIITVAAVDVLAQSRVYKCVDAAGKVTLSDRGCGAGDTAAIVKVAPANSIEGSQYREGSNELAQDARQSEQARPQSVLISERREDENERKRLCKEASTPHRGAHGLTAAQRSASAQLCADISLAIPDESIPSESPASQSPGLITSCDQGGCWDTNGVRYNHGADNTYFPSYGGPACQLVAGNMICP